MNASVNTILQSCDRFLLKGQVVIRPTANTDALGRRLQPTISVTKHRQMTNDW